MKKKKFKQKRKTWFNALKVLLRVHYLQPKFSYLGEKPTGGAIILCNHEGSYAPTELEIYADFPIRIWGTAEMNSGLKNVYKYLSRTYFHEKKHFRLSTSKFFAIFASPFVNLFYKGLNIISTYRDARLYKTISESVKVIRDDGDNIVIFPENSEHGYFKRLTQFHAGFAVLAQKLLNSGIDVPIFVAYFKKQQREFVFSPPVLFSELKAKFGTKEKIAAHLLEVCNDLGNCAAPQ